MGKELDSLADVVTFGVLPGMMIFNLYHHLVELPVWPAYFAFAVPIFSAFRLAIFNRTKPAMTISWVWPRPAQCAFIGTVTRWAGQRALSCLDYYRARVAGGFRIALVKRPGIAHSVAGV